jgi:hypothetical protein
LEKYMIEQTSKRTGSLAKLAALISCLVATQLAHGQGGTHESTPECCGTKPTFAQVGQPNVYSSFNGQIAAATCFPSNPTGGYPAPFDPTAFAFGIVDLQNPAPPVNVNYAAPMFSRARRQSMDRREIGEHFWRLLR